MSIMPLHKLTKNDSSIVGNQQSLNDPLHDSLRQPNDAIHPFQIPAHKDKKRHLFRFGRKKSRSDMGGSVFGTSSSTVNVVPTSVDGSSNASLRKKSKDFDNHSIFNDMLGLDESGMTAYNERKKSNSSNQSRARERDHSEGSLVFANDKDIKLDQDFNSMEGIINPVYNRTSISQQSHSEHWAPPDSWKVEPAEDSMDEIHTPSYSNKTDRSDYFPVVEHEGWDMPSKNYCIRVFRPDGTFGTLIAPLYATTQDLIHRLIGKFFLNEKKQYKLSLVIHDRVRLLEPNERPIQIQKTLLEQIGFTEQDRIEDIGREDNSYLFRFVLRQDAIQSVRQDDIFVQSRRVDLQGKNLEDIPIFLHDSKESITHLLLSKNPLITIAEDFLQGCIALKHLWLTNNDYHTLPSYIRVIPHLENLNISCNHLKDLDHAQLHQLNTLRTLRAYNNRLESLPASFSAFKHLSVLYISNNCFTKFPSVICNISGLAYLDISFNKIASFPEEIGQMTQLAGLFATANRLTGRLPAGFAKLENLQELDLRQNQLTDLEDLYELPKLEVISIDYNAISLVSYDFKSLRQLKMSKNHLTQFTIAPSHLYHPDGTLKNVRCMLTDLNLANCKLSSLPDDVFASAVSLEHLILDNNTLSALPSSIGSLSRLLRLSVQSNNLELLPSEISKLTELKVLDAQKNNLKALPKEIWLCVSLQTLNCSSNLLESFPEPCTAAYDPPVDKTVETSLSGTQATSPPPRIDTTHVKNTVTPIMTPNVDNIPPNLLSNGFHPPSNFNPPSFFASPRNHPPPLSLSLRHLYLGDNRFTDDIWSPLSLFLELRTLNLCFNDLYEIPPEGLCHQHLYELHLSGNHLASLPADDLEKLSYLRVLAVNGNKLQTLPAEIGKLRKLLILDVGNNVLKYNISNWPYDWNWNWNLSLKYLNLSGNKRLEIKKTHPEIQNPKEKNLSDFSALVKLRMLGLMDVTILGVSTPEEFHDRRVRTSPSEVNGMGYGVADWLGPSDHLATWDLVMPRFRNRDDECVFGLFDGRKHSKTGCQLTHFLNENLTYHLANELDKTKHDDTIVSALRRTFLALQKEFGSMDTEPKDLGASAVLCYISGTRLHVANVGDALAVLCRNNGQVLEITQKHIPLNPSEISRIRAAGGYVSNAGLLNDELSVSRSFGYYHLIPVVNANPFISTINLAQNDEFVIMASHGLWDRMSYQTAVDIARTEKDDLMIAAQKLRDFALTYGADDNIMVMIIGVGDLFDKRDRRFRNMRGLNIGTSRAGTTDPMLIDEPIGTPGIMAKNKRRIKDESPSDSTLARLEREVPPPTNQVALVFTDIKSSTLLWDTQPEDMRSAIKIHDSVMRRTLRSIGGYEVKTEGDAFMVCFQDTVSALLWCFTVQLQLLEADWPAGILETEEGREIQKDNMVIYRGLSVRMGIHLGRPVHERNPITKRMDYFGPVVNKASRICNAADGGQICVSSDVITALREMPGVFGDDKTSSADAEADDHDVHSLSRDIQQLRRLGFQVVDMGERRLKGLETPEMLSLVYPKQLSGRMEIDKNEVLGGVMTHEQTPGAEEPETSGENPSQLDTQATQQPGNSNINSNIDSNSKQEQVRKIQLPQPLTIPIPSRQNRQIDPAYVLSLNNLAIRLESITTGTMCRKSQAERNLYARMSMPSSLVALTANHGSSTMVNGTKYSQDFNRRVQEVASDDELLMLMETFVTRIENATSTIYLQKMGQFSGVLEKLGEAIELDPMHILRALQIYSEVNGLTHQ
ncbi:hypothetical protein BD560DRAFT_367244 [Blakeslea trispora]|nr:hypothetical protein BD560DRAFT_367244 [Blakeslea trispora]